MHRHHHPHRHDNGAFKMPLRSVNAQHLAAIEHRGNRFSDWLQKSIKPFSLQISTIGCENRSKPLSLQIFAIG